jgi:hypothetical protein
VKSRTAPSRSRFAYFLCRSIVGGQISEQVVLLLPLFLFVDTVASAAIVYAIAIAVATAPIAAAVNISTAAIVTSRGHLDAVVVCRGTIVGPSWAMSGYLCHVGVILFQNKHCWGKTCNIPLPLFWQWLYACQRSARAG